MGGGAVMCSCFITQGAAMMVLMTPVSRLTLTILSFGAGLVYVVFFSDILTVLHFFFAVWVGLTRRNRGAIFLQSGAPFLLRMKERKERALAMYS